MAPSHRRVIHLLAVCAALACTLASAAPAGAANGGVSIREARKAALVKVHRLERKLRDTGATGSRVPGCWRETRRAVGCLGIVRGRDEFVRWRCAVPMTIRRRSAGTASASRLAVRFTDTMCAF